MTSVETATAIAYASQQDASSLAKLDAKLSVQELNGCRSKYSRIAQRRYSFEKPSELSIQDLVVRNRSLQRTIDRLRKKNAAMHAAEKLAVEDWRKDLTNKRAARLLAEMNFAHACGVQQ